MRSTHTKDTAEAVLRELPSVLGACVREDVGGRPREVHLLVRNGPNVRDLAHDVRDMLEERLGMAIDQRIISIAQLAPDPPAGSEADDASADPVTPAERSPAPGSAPGSERLPDAAGVDAAAVDAGADPDESGSTSGPRPPESAGHPAAQESQRDAPSRSSGSGGGDPRLVNRVVYGGLETSTAASRVSVRVRLSWQGAEFVGEASEVDVANGRARAAAIATLRAATAVCRGDTRLELEAASVARALEQDYALVTALAAAPWIGRRPATLCGAHLVEGDDVATAAALATLKATNRVMERALRPSDGA